LNDSFKWWQSYAQAYTDFVFDATRQTLDQSMALRESAGQLMADALKKNQALNARERGLALELAHTFNSQAQVATEQAAEMFKTIFAIVTTAPLSNWAAERAAQLSQAAAADGKKK
jgi:hypothetical protein